ncbi:hypothetical protein PILCRDRAFT_16661 [Piloderma croceum F 1598]|uniref:Uncharacterized protein n=1 Tax=Piloderma croceum (strain F 1598) TaxID=765440 RepID=A0A0C3EVK6_PILCF|nr:hypothetical protein PILCRDRAFT_16661 [Piloderma croceum F 1598]
MGGLNGKCPSKISKANTSNRGDLGNAGKDGKKQGGEIGEVLGRKDKAGSNNVEGDSTALKTRGSGISKASIRGEQQRRGDDGTHNDDGTKFFRRIHVICIRGGITFVDFLASSSRVPTNLAPKPVGYI